MKTFLKSSILITFLLVGYQSIGQQFSNASSYLDFISAKEKGISKELWDYTSTVARGKSARKVNNRRQDLIETIKKAKQDIAKMPAFEGSKSFRDSAVSHLTLYYRVINEDYSKIMDMEDIAEQSYDNMEAYVLAQRIASEKLQESSEKFEKAYNGFAEANNITLIKSEDKLYKNLEKAGKAFDYYNDIFLILFKSQNQENYLTKAVNEGNLNALEQAKSALLSFSDEGIAKLAEAKAFNGDASLKTACSQLLKFYNQEAKDKTKPIVDYLIEKEKFEKIKKSFDAKSQNSRTKEDVEQFNKAVNDYNKVLNAYNKNNQELNSARTKAFDIWTNAVKSFLDRQVPQK